MKTWRQFREDMDYAQETLMLEAKGFGGVARRRRKKKRFQSKRDEKVQALKSRPTLWKGLT